MSREHDIQMQTDTFKLEATDETAGAAHVGLHPVVSRRPRYCKPSENKFHVGNAKDGKHYWLTPPELYAALDAQYHFDFDPCPHPKPDGFNGLAVEWGKSSYVNPPFCAVMMDGKKKGITAWARKALEEHKKGKRVVFVFPLDKWMLMLMDAGATVKNLGDVKWHAVEDNQKGPGTGRHVGCFVLEPPKTANNSVDGWIFSLSFFKVGPDFPFKFLSGINLSSKQLLFTGWQRLQITLQSRKP